MIGKKHLRDVRAGLLEECARAGLDPMRWFDAQIGKLELSRSPNETEIETLKLIRDGLQSKPSAGKRKRTRPRSRSAR